MDGHSDQLRGILTRLWNSRWPSCATKTALDQNSVNAFHQNASRLHRTLLALFSVVLSSALSGSESISFGSLASTSSIHQLLPTRFRAYHCYVSCHCWAFSLFNLLCFGLCDFNQKSALKQSSFVGFSHVLAKSLRFSKTEQNDQQLCSDWGCPSMHCNVCTVSSNGSAHPAKSGCPPPTTWPTFFWQPPQRSRPPWSYFSELDSVPPSLSRQSGETHMRLNKPTASCCATKKKQTCLPKSVVGALHWMEREGMHQVDRGRHACRCQLFVTINQVGIKTRLTRF